MKIFLFPTLYRDTTGGHVAEEGMFVRVGKKTKTIGYGEQWEWQKVAKVFPFIYEPVGEAFFDIADMFSRVK